MKNTRTRILGAALLSATALLVMASSAFAISDITVTPRPITAGDGSLTIAVSSVGNGGALYGNGNYWTSPIDASGTFEWFNQPVDVVDFTFPDTVNGTPVLTSATYTRNSGAGYGAPVELAGPSYTLAFDGVYGIQAVGNDGVADVNGEILPALGIDMIDPVVTTNVVPFFGGTPTVTISATDTLSGMEGILLNVDGTRNISWEPSPIDPADFSVDASFVGEGIHTVMWYAFDNAGNATHGMETFTVDNTAPQTTSNTLASYTGTATIDLTATDNIGGSGVAHTYYILDGEPQAEGTVVEVAPPVAGSDPHTLEFWSEDAVGNVETPHQSVNFTVSAAVIPVTRISSGTNNWATAVAAAQRQFTTPPAVLPDYTGIRSIILASGDVKAQADPLSAAGMCWAYQTSAGNAPLLLVSSAVQTDPQVLALIDSIVAANAGNTITIRIVGGSASVPDARYNEIAAYVASHSAGTLAKDRVLNTGGRYDLAAAIATRMQQRANASLADSLVLADEVLVANGADSTKFFDPLALSPIAAHRGAPILLVTATSIPTATSAKIANLRAANPATAVYIGGGTGTVSDAVKVALSATRISGADRYLNAIAIADYAFAHGWLSDAAPAGVAATILDAQIGGTLVGAKGGALVLTPTSSLNADTAAWLTANKGTLPGAYVFGTVANLSAGVKTAVENALN